MTQHKWAKEIKAWADGAEIVSNGGCGWFRDASPDWNDDYEFRIKPQPKEDEIEKEWNRRMAEKALAIPEISEAIDRLFEAFALKEPQYLYVYKGSIGHEPIFCFARSGDRLVEQNYIGKIKLEDENE